MCRASTTIPPQTIRSPACPNCRRGRRFTPNRSLRQGMRRNPRPATPSRRWWPNWKSWRLAARRPTRRSSAPSRRVTTCSRRDQRWCRRGSPSLSPGCWRSTSPSWWTTSSPPSWRNCWMRSPQAMRIVSRCSPSSTAARRAPRVRGWSHSSVDWATLMPADCQPFHSRIQASMFVWAATAPTSNHPMAAARTCLRTCRRMR